MPWPGGKSATGVYHRLCAEVPPHDERVSLFLGHCAVMRHLRPAQINVGIDLDERALELWRGFDWPPAAPGSGARAPLQLLHADAFGWLRFRFGLLEWPRPAARFLRPHDLLQRLYGGRHRSADASGHDGGSPWIPFLIVDPPYPRATLSSRHRYVADLTDEQHEELLDLLRSVPALVLVLSYPNKLYADRLREWRTFTYRGQTRGGSRTEQAWCNYPPPIVLHDHRYIGRDRRQREALARHVRLRRKLFRRLPPPARAALLDNLIEEERQLSHGQSIYAGVCERCGTTRPADVALCSVCGSRESRPAWRKPFLFMPGDIDEPRTNGSAAAAESGGGQQNGRAQPQKRKS